MKISRVHLPVQSLLLHCEKEPRHQFPEQTSWRLFKSQVKLDVNKTTFHTNPQIISFSSSCVEGTHILKLATVPLLCPISAPQTAIKGLLTSRSDLSKMSLFSSLLWTLLVRCEWACGRTCWFLLGRERGALWKKPPFFGVLSVRDGLALIGCGFQLT